MKLPSSYEYLFEALFVCFSVYSCNVQEEEIPAAVSNMFIVPFHIGGNCYVLVNKTLRFIFHYE
jgi:hypothetical protein